MTPDELAKIRQQEQLNAAAVLGVKSVDFMGINDGELENTNVTREGITWFIRLYQPDAILTWNPDRFPQQYKWEIEHSDHRASGQITLDWYEFITVKLLTIEKLLSNSS